MVDVDSNIAGSRARILRAGALQPLTTAALLLAGSSVWAQENWGTEQQRLACTPDVSRLSQGDLIAAFHGSTEIGYVRISNDSALPSFREELSFWKRTVATSIRVREPH